MSNGSGILLASGTPLPTALPMNLAGLLVPTDRTLLDQKFYNTRFTLLVQAINQLYSQILAFQGVEDTLVQSGLDRINTLLTPYLSTLQQAANLGFLVCEATGVSVALVATNAANFQVNTGAALFTPTAYLLAQDQGDSNNWGLLQLVDYTASNGTLQTNVIYANSPGQFSSAWTISCNSAVLPVMIDLANQAQTAAANAQSDLASIASDIATMNALIAELETGAVLSVNGYTGIVTLATGDIVGLNSALAAKVGTVLFNSTVAGLQPLSTTLTALGAVGLIAGNALVALGPGSIGQQAVADNSSAIATANSVNAAIAAATINSSQIAASGIDNSNTSVIMQASDNGTWKNLTASAAVTVTVPKTLARGWNCMLHQSGTGQAHRLWPSARL
jgi:hypothetical protein